MAEQFKNDHRNFFQFFKSQTCISSTGGTDDGSTTGPPSVSTTASMTAENRLEIYTISFEDYLQCLQRYNFAHILLVHLNPSVAREFYMEIIEFLVDEIEPSKPIESRIFSFYTLYTVWHVINKAYNLKEKIKLDHRRLEWIQQLTKEAIRRKQFDVSLAYRLLFCRRAFAFCHSATALYGPHYQDYNLRRGEHSGENVQKTKNTETIPELEQYLQIMEQQLSDICQGSCDSLKQLLHELNVNH